MGRSGNGNSGHRLIDSIRTAKKNLESFRIKMSGSVAFTCACCRMTWSHQKLGGVYNYEPTAALSSRVVGPAAYAVCDKCKSSLSTSQIHQKVTKYLAGQGLFK